MRRPPWWAVLALVGLAVVAVLIAGSLWPRPPGAPGAASAPPTRAAASVDPVSGLRWVERADLPPQARDTLARIAAGGPFPYAKDGSTFYNNERLLPRQPSGYYREFTVKTPGESDRGARRIVTGGPAYGVRNGEFYYTDDHYQSYRRIVP